MSAAFRPRNFALCALGLALAGFMQVLDSTIANVSLPTIAGNLGGSAQQTTWVVTSFTIFTAIALPLSGWFARRFGEVRVFVAATGLFTLSSILCGMASNMNMLILCRALQGFAAGPIFPVTQALMISIFPANRRSQAIAMVTMVTIVAPIAGPILGGWITDSYSWPWIFFINVPVGIFAIYAVWTQMKHKPEQIQRVKIDYVGITALAVGVSALQIVLDMGNDEDWFDSKFIVAAAIIAAIAIAVFLIWELTEEHPIVDLHLFHHRNFAVGTLCYMFFFAVFLGTSVLVPIWLQSQLHYTPFMAGLAVAPMGVFPVLTVPLLGKFAHRMDMRLTATLAFVGMAVACFIYSNFNPEVDFATVAWLQLFQGLGVGLFFMPIMTIVLSDLKPEEISAGAGLAMFMRMLSGSFSVAIINYMWNTRAVHHHAHLAERFTPASPGTIEAVDSLGHGNTQLAMSKLDLMVTEQAYQISFNELFLGFTILLLSLTLLIWLAKPPFSGQTAHATSEGH